MLGTLTNDAPSLTLAIGMPQGWEWFILLGLGLLIFGRRLPEVGKSVGRAIVEFKKGIKGIGDELESESAKPSTAYDNSPNYRAPLNSSGADPRVSRAETVEAEPGKATT